MSISRTGERKNKLEELAKLKHEDKEASGAAAAATVTL
jgi:hypothetical protein